MNAHKLGSLEKTSNKSHDNEIINKIEQLSNGLEQLSNRIKQPSIKTSHIITLHDDPGIVILPKKICEGCEMALVEFKSLEIVNRGTIRVHVNNIKNTYYNNVESKYIHSFYHNGGKIKQRPPALIYCPITEEYGSFIHDQEIELSKFFLKLHIKT